MKSVILCGGYGMRMREITVHDPKPLAVVGGKPILWHIMKIYSRYGFDDFILPLGYKGEKIKEFFMDCEWKQNDFILDFSSDENRILLLKRPEKWKIAFIDTGIDTMTGGRIKRIQPFIDEDTFLVTYGDGLCDIDIRELLKYHREKGKIATLTGIQKKSQFGILKAKDGIVTSFEEKSEIEGLINGGFFVFSKEIFEYLDGDQCVLEKEPFTRLTSEGQLAVYEHKGFWKAVDTYKDIQDMEADWDNLSKALGI